jgi:hypothetical protein
MARDFHRSGDAGLAHFPATDWEVRRTAGTLQLQNAAPASGVLYISLMPAWRAGH